MVVNRSPRAWAALALMVLVAGGCTWVGRVSVGNAGGEGDSTSSQPAISADGRYVAFVSSGSLVLDDTNDSSDVFLRDTVAGTTTRVSVDGTGAQGNHGSIDPAISADGQYVAFASEASNLVAADTNNNYDTFVRDRVNGTTTRVSVNSTGSQDDEASLAPAISGDGRHVAFESRATNLVDNDTNNGTDVFVHDTVTGTTERASVDKDENQGDGASLSASISADGRFVAFSSFATNLVRDDHNHVNDVFVRANPEPVTRMFTPDAFFPGTTTPMTVDGFDFFPGAVLQVDGVGVTFDNVTVVSPTEITTDVVVAPDAPAGTRNVFIKVPATGPGLAYVAIGFCQGCITVRPPTCVVACVLPNRSIAHR